MNRGWEVTFSDMLTLLVTFFVFIISISVFKTIEYEEFWKTVEARDREQLKQAPTTSFTFPLIKDLNIPALNPEARGLLSDLSTVLDTGGWDGIDVYYDEHKISLMVSEQLSFDEGEFTLKEAVKPLLLKLVEPVNRSKFDMNIEGHADAPSPSAADDMDLSLRRALAAARCLIGGGVDKSKITISGYGAQRPIDTSGTPAARRRNSRVEVNIIIAHD
jgi:chemotaxis protein MotB